MSNPISKKRRTSSRPSNDHRSNISKAFYSAVDQSDTEDVFSEETRKIIKRILEVSSSKVDTNKSPVIGFTCSTFDLIHPGHILMLQDSRNQCDYLVVGVQSDPTIDRPNKNTPIQTFEERQIMINSCKYVDAVIEYSTENDLYNILMSLLPDIRILGSDWRGKQYTGFDINQIKIHWHDRSTHNYSTTSLRERIYSAEILRRIN